MEKQKLHPKYQLQVFAPDDWIQVNLPTRKPHSLLLKNRERGYLLLDKASRQYHQTRINKQLKFWSTNRRFQVKVEKSHHS